MTNSNYQEFDEKLMMMYSQTRFYDEDELSVEGELLQVVQNLDREQYEYEFPTKTCLRALAYLDREDCYFDESSFISSTTIAALSSVDYFDQETMIDQLNLWHETDDDDPLIADARLSPLQLPAQVTDRHLPRESMSCMSSQLERPVGPSSFLSDPHMCKVTQSRVYKGYQQDQQNLRAYRNASLAITESSTESSSVRSMESRTVLIKINKCKSITIVQSTPAYSTTDEGYDDTIYTGELESQVEFYPICEEEQQDIVTRDSEQEQFTAAAIKIQSLWRGYKSRKIQRQFSSLRPEQRVVANLAQLCGRNYRHKMNQVEDRLYQLEQRLREETVMRVSFEKAMEDMTIVMDQQQKILCDRLEQEVHMREVYEDKMNTALAQLQPLESRLRKEISARSKMEEMMTRVLDQMHETETSRQQQVKEDAESKKQMQYKLDLALEDISLLKKVPRSSSRLQKNDSTKNLMKKENSTTRSTVRKSIVPTTNKLDVSRRPASRQQQVFERPSVIPSNRRPVLGSNQRTSTKPNTTTATTTTTTATSRRPLLSRK
ncbi:hypothetical protein EDC94DRAFT_546255 [Helicostylum pulchrum]|nr:hypothetical protein EDC94DRAFT_546255 [Helicostylum pulchrum]